ncbi:MAG: alpha/beta hydrolase [Stenotrophomonas sp.]
MLEVLHRGHAKGVALSDPLPLQVIVLPGLDGTGWLSVPFVDELRAHGLDARVLALPCTGAQDYSTLAKLLRPQLPAQPFVLLAESFAGPLAMELAAGPLPGLRGLVLCTTFARRPVPFPASAAKGLAPAWPMPPVPLMARLLLGRWRTRNNQQALQDALAQVPSSVLRQRAAATLRVDVRALLPRIQAPTLNVQALQDRLLWPPSVRELQALLPNARHIAIEGPHLLLQARAEPAAALIARWIKALPG